MLAGAHALLALVRMHLSRRGQDRSLKARLTQALGEVGGPVRNAVLLGDFLRAGRVAADEADDLDAVDHLQRIKVLLSERTLPCDQQLHVRFSRMMWPTAVLDAGT